jgi:cation diffusion facilitator CzcD-associated flavoprotein CzcO
MRAKRVVIATGYPRVPKLPSWPGRERFGGTVIHSSEYKNGKAFRDKRVLVVGFGNSGGEIAIDLHEHGARPSIAVRSPVNVIPREILGVPVLAIGIATAWMPPAIADATSAPIIRATVGDITKLGFRKLPYGPMRQIKEHRRIPLIDIGTIALIRRGKLALRRDVRELHEKEVVFEDGVREPFDAIVAATGYAPRVDAIAPELDLDADGCPRTSGAEIAPGLHVCGFYVSPTGMLREIGIEAERIAASIAS